MADTKEKLHDEFVVTMDGLHDGWSALLAADPQFFKAGLTLASVPRRKQHLSLKDQAMIGLSVNAAATHLYRPGIKAHIAAARKEGATIDEVLEVVELTSTLGIHACNIGVPLLVETKDVVGAPTPRKGALSPKMKELVYCAFDTAATHLYVPGLKLHMKNALGYGATPQEILEVMEIATLLSLQTAHETVPMIAELYGA
ncbi:hypothetical protein SCUCBS95973_009118 [Sporothrix curviconia]|uniref:Carboxymuconolactone decarboxylase-like domain-containing protein n=1 Tax=Sporothrix curviconia TaxID=1260050 RepID=A0ABP0CTV7_9PEZI